MKIKNQDFLKRENQSLVLDLILEQGPISRAEIAKQTSMSPTSASRIVTSLLDANLIKEEQKSSTGVGRKAVYLAPNESSIISIGVEIDLNMIRVAFVNFIGERFINQSFHLTTSSPDKVVDFIAETIQSLVKKENVPYERIIGVCIGIPGLIENENGFIKTSAQFKWKEIPLKEMLEEKIPYTIQVENELKLKALAEHVATQSMYKTMVVIGFGSGVGSALITNGEIYRGDRNFSGEIGHTTVDPFGTYCPCGSFGCLQTYIAEGFLIDEVSKTRPIQSVEEIVLEYEHGQKWAVNILDKASTYAAIAINNVVCTYNPEAIILSGSLIEKHPVIRNLIIEKYQTNVWPPLANSFDLKLTKTKDKGVVMGAALSLQQNFIKDINF